MLYAILVALLPACHFEDDPNCYFDAGDAGTSFIAIADHEGFWVLYANGDVETYKE